MTSIGRSAFSNCSSLTSISIPNSVTRIGDHAFYYCSNLTSITIPNSVTSIGGQAFYGCSSLTTITIPNSVIELCNSSNAIYYWEREAFAYCTSLEKVVLSNKPKTIPNSCFEGCTSLTTIEIPASVTKIGVRAFNNCSKLSYNVYDNANYLGNANNPYMVLMEPISTDITSCEIAESCQIIHDISYLTVRYPGRRDDAFAYVGCFYNCSNLQFNTYDNAYYLGSASNPYALLVRAVSTSITNCKINPNCKYISDGAFWRCENLSSLEIPLGVISVGELIIDGWYDYNYWGADTIMYAGTVEEMEKIHVLSRTATTHTEEFYIIHCSDGDFVFYSGTSCFYIDTEIDCWDEKRKRRYKKKLRDLTYDDNILVWNFDRGCFATAKAMFITRPQIAKAYTLTTFSDGTVLKTIGADDTKRHRLLMLTLANLNTSAQI